MNISAGQKVIVPGADDSGQESEFYLRNVWYTWNVLGSKREFKIWIPLIKGTVCMSQSCSKQALSYVEEAQHLFKIVQMNKTVFSVVNPECHLSRRSYG